MSWVQLRTLASLETCFTLLLPGEDRCVSISKVTLGGFVYLLFSLSQRKQTRVCAVDLLAKDSHIAQVQMFFNRSWNNLGEQCHLVVEFAPISTTNTGANSFLCIHHYIFIFYLSQVLVSDINMKYTKET